MDRYSSYASYVDISRHPGGTGLLDEGTAQPHTELHQPGAGVYLQSGRLYQAYVRSIDKAGFAVERNFGKHQRHFGKNETLNSGCSCNLNWRREDSNYEQK